MKLYYSPGACSLSPHIVMREAGIPVSLVKVDIRARKMEDGGDYTAISKKGYVPTLELDDGQRLTEGPAIVQYLADKAPQSGLAPTNGTVERYRVQEWLNFITSELHKNYSWLFNPTAPDSVKATVKERLAQRYAYISGELAGKDYLMGKNFSVADAYLFTVMNWSARVGVEINDQRLKDYHARVGARPKVQEAMKAEGLLK
ncbi:MAG: glutathione transferase GstA [Alphaproteobacteria bacterium]|nr:glutathione transferase GstA [Alphaproteobacteria bacterium]